MTDRPPNLPTRATPWSSTVPRPAAAPDRAPCRSLASKPRAVRPGNACTGTPARAAPAQVREAEAQVPAVVQAAGVVVAVAVEEVVAAEAAGVEALVPVAAQAANSARSPV